MICVHNPALENAIPWSAPGITANSARGSSRCDSAFASTVMNWSLSPTISSTGLSIRAAVTKTWWQEGSRTQQVPEVQPRDASGAVLAIWGLI